MNRQSFKLIDCTLRDGGYYNNWEFPRKLVTEYLQAMESAGIDIVEIGFRSFNSKKFHGPYFYTTDNYLRSLQLPNSLKYAVMVNAAELISHEAGVVRAVETLFNTADEAPISMVRIASHYSELDLIKDGLKLLKSYGYQVGLNLMQISDRTAMELEEFAKIGNECNVDILYFADSTGSLSNHDTNVVVSTIQKFWTGDIGIHAHNNMGNALTNSQSAVALGVSWVDSTVAGMGRGPGNLETENILLASMGVTIDQRKIGPLLKVINMYFQDLKNKYCWGQNPYYYLSGRYGIHPTYIQEMLSDKRYDEGEILSTINYLRTRDSKKFAKDTLDMGRFFYSGNPSGTWKPKDFLAGKDVLVIGSGDSVRLHADGIEGYIRQKKPIVIALNDQSCIESRLIDYRAVCHPFRLTANKMLLSKFGGKLVIPYSQLSENEHCEYANGEFLDFGISIGGDRFEYHEVFANLPLPLGVGYALAIASSGKANHIYLAGFDGYDIDDPRFHEMEQLFGSYIASPGSVQITSITGTRYKIEQSSLYAN